MTQKRLLFTLIGCLLFTFAIYRGYQFVSQVDGGIYYVLGAVAVQIGIYLWLRYRFSQP